MKTNNNNNNMLVNEKCLKANQTLDCKQLDIDVVDEFDAIEIKPKADPVLNPTTFIYETIKSALLNDPPISKSKVVAQKQVELFEKNMDPKNTLRFNETKLDTEVGKAVVNGSANLAPVALRQDIPTSTPTFHDSSPGTIRITHREMVGALTGVATDDFSTSFRIQPASKSTFPWLSQVANLFESYTFNFLRVIYVPRVPTSSAGQIGLALDFDADDEAPSSLVGFSQYANSVIGSVWAGLSLTVQGNDLQKCVRERYTDHNSGKSIYDPILHDVANLRIAILSTPVEVIGQIYIEYDITLRTPEPSTRGYLTFKRYGPGTTDGQLFNPLHTIFGTDRAGIFPASLVNVEEVPVRMVHYSSPTAGYYTNAISIREPGTFLIRVFSRFVDNAYAASWADSATALGNLDTTYTCISQAEGGSVVSTWPIVNNGRVEFGAIGTGNLFDITLDTVVNVTDATNNGFTWTLTPPAGAGYNGSAVTAQYHYLLVVRYAGSTLAVPTLSQQQLKHPLKLQYGDQSLSGRKDRRAILDLANAMGKGDLPSIKKLKFKPSKIKSNKKSKKQPNSKKHK